MTKGVRMQHVLRHYWTSMRKYPISGIFVFLLFASGSVLASAITPLLYKQLIDVMSNGLPGDEAVTYRLFVLVALIGTLIVAYNVIFRIADYVMTYFQSNVLRELANDAFQKLHGHSYSFFANNFTGSLVTKAKRYVRSFEIIHDRITFSFVFAGARIVGAIVVMFLYAPLVGVVYVGWILLYGAIVAYFIKVKMPYDLREAKADSKVTARYADTITNALAVKMFSSFSHEKKAFFNVTDKEEKRRRQAWNMNNWQMLLQGILFGTFEIAVMALAVWLWIDGKITIGTVVLLQVFVIGTFQSVWDFGRALSDIAKAFADAKEMVEIFEQDPSVLDPADPEPCRIHKGDIEFRNVSFSYEHNKQNIFEDFSLRIVAGERVGLIGHSGAGKTTLTKLLLRFADISDGEIRIDGHSIARIKQDDLRRNISYVPQDPVLFHRTLRENIAYGKPNATEEEIVTASKRAHAHEFIVNLPKGYDTLVGERGVKLSGGERQRVAIARAMLKNAPILILDEATSSLDSLSEKYIQEALDELMEGRTTIVVAHRLSTIQKMDRILVIERGSVIEEGDHQTLLDTGGVYAMFWKQQVGGFIGE